MWLISQCSIPSNTIVDSSMYHQCTNIKLQSNNGSKLTSHQYQLTHHNLQVRLKPINCTLYKSYSHLSYKIHENTMYSQSTHTKQESIQIHHIILKHLLIDLSHAVQTLQGPISKSDHYANRGPSDRNW